MNILFVHQNLPGQYKHIVPALVADKANRVAFITKEGKPDIPGVMKATYKLARDVTPNIHQYLTRFEDQVLHGQGAVRAALHLEKEGFKPDMICAHTGWGEALFLRELYEDVPILAFSEFYYNNEGADIGFRKGDEPDLDRKCRTRIRNLHMLSSMEGATWCFSPTWWQRSQHPAAFREKMSVIHDGVDTDLCQRMAEPFLDLPTGRRLTREDEVITYIARNLEPYRGFDIFMEALGEICRLRPKAEIVIVGGDDVSYGEGPKDAVNWREKMLSLAHRGGNGFDPKRVHFLGRVPYDTYRHVLSLSRAHIYLTYPFVLSWSALEAMSHECLLIASDTAPVTEVIEDGKNGVLVDFFDPGALAKKVANVLEEPEKYEDMRKAARRTVVEKYDLKTVCLPAQLKLIETLAAGGLPDPVPDP